MAKLKQSSLNFVVVDGMVTDVSQREYNGRVYRSVEIVGVRFPIADDVDFPRPFTPISATCRGVKYGKSDKQLEIFRWEPAQVDKG